MWSRINLICDTLQYIIINYRYAAVHFLIKCCIYYYEGKTFQFIENDKVDEDLRKVGNFQKLSILKFLSTL
jgi:hypothetical protein